MSLYIKKEDINDALEKLNEKYDIYAPMRYSKKGRYSDTDSIRYGKINNAEDIVFDEKSDYPAKEVLTPITEALFYFVNGEIIEKKEKSTKDILLFMHPCDVHAMERQDNIYLKNSADPDYYYKRMRDRVKVVLMECPNSFDTCYCVSMNTNKTDHYDLAVKNDANGWFVEFKDDTFKDYFDGEENDYTIKFVEENKLKAEKLDIKDLTILKKLKEHPMWDEFNSRCTSCGACTMACPTCTCFTQKDIPYTENGEIGERRRVSISCQMEEYAKIAGGFNFRSKASDRMRYKVLHKFYDYRNRFGEDMCVGCGRCIDMCPHNISILETVHNMNEAIKEIEKEGK